MLAVADIPRSIQFYKDSFGFSVLIEEPYYALLSLGSLWLYVVTESPPTPDKPTVTLGTTGTNERTSANIVFHVSDCKAAYEALSQAGVQFLAPPQQPPWGGWRCFAQDPDGYLIEIEEYELPTYGAR
jgi:catechol 2,3-dioxygenase-like lactoylglutathione lyase family enzyme